MSLDASTGVVPGAAARTPAGAALLMPALAFAFDLMAAAAAGVLLLLGQRVYALTAGESAPARLAFACAVAAGAALGAVLGERHAARQRWPLRAAGVALAATGAAAVLAVPMFRLARAGFLILAPVLGGGAVGLWSLRFMLAVSLVILPAGLLAAALAGFGRALSPRATDARALNLSFAIGLLFAGMGLGLLAAPAMILGLGLRGALFMALALAGIGGAGLVVLSWRGLEGEGVIGSLAEPGAAAPGQDAGPAAGGAPEGPPGRFVSAEAMAEEESIARSILIAATILFGFAGWGYFLIWDRTLGLISGPALPARAITAGVFVGSVAAGVMLASGIMERVRRTSLALLVLVVASAVAASLSMYLVPRIAVLYLGLTPFLERPALGWLPPAAAAATLMLSGGVLVGAALAPWIAALGMRGRTLSRLVPLLLGGAILAQLVLEEMVVPDFGVRRALALTAAIGLMAALLLAGAVPFRTAAVRPTLTLLILGLMIVVGGFAASWDPRVVGAGLYRYGARSLERFASVDQYLAARRSIDPLFYREGREATVMVERSEQPALGQVAGEGLALTVDGRVEATTGQDLRTQVLQGHIPVLVHGPTEEVLVAGYLNGVSAGAVLRHPVSRLVLIERDPAVVEAGALFAPFNDLPHDDPRCTIVVDTARPRLLADRAEFDVIILTTAEPWLRHDAALLTREGYDAVKARLKEGGLVAQRVQATAMPVTALRMLLRTFASGFEHVLAFQISPEDLLLIGSSEPLGLDVGWLRNVLSSQAAVQEDLRRALVPTPNEILNLFRFDREALLRLAGEGPINDDGRSAVEAITVRSLRIHDNPEFLASLDEARVPIVAHLRNYGATPGDQADFLYGLAKSYLGLAGDVAGARAVVEELRRLGMTARARWVMGEIFLQESKVNEALEEWEAVLEMEPKNLDALFSLGTYYQDSRDYWRAEPFLARAAREHAEAPVIRYHYGRVLYALGKNKEAVTELREAVRLAGEREQYPLVPYVLGLALHKLKRDAEAAASLEKYLEWAYTQPLTHVEVDAHMKLAEVYDVLGRRFDGFKQRQRAEDLRRRLTAAAVRQAPPAAPAPGEAPPPGGTAAPAEATAPREAAPAEAPPPAAPTVEPPPETGPTPAAGTDDAAPSPPGP